MDSMRIFYTGSDIEDLAANGIRQLEISPEVTLTDAARERAEELGVSLVTPADASARKIVEQTIPAKVETLPNRPRGCQHGPLPRSISQSRAVGGQGPMVDQLVEAVSALKKRGD
jgi:plasmid stabilization system protein ParE